MILLDTCTFLWLAADQKKISKKAKDIIEKHADGLFVSAISAFEIAIKNRSGKLKLPIPVEDWFIETLDFHGLHELPVTSSIAVASVQLPPIHNDPCDRIIIATAQMNNMKICTCDKLISQYKEVSVVW